jgi:RNA polymerase sigma-70 factor (ECF subfamily)
MESIPEADLVREARRGVEEAFLGLYQRHRTAIFQFAWRLTGSRAAADDVTQECFLTLIRSAGFDAGRGNLRSYLFGIARNLVFRQLRISCREAEEAADTTARIDMLADMLQAERSELVAAAIARLPVLQREAIVLFTFEELPLEQIARIAGVDPGAVKSRLHRARQTLRTALAPLLTGNSDRRFL